MKYVLGTMLIVLSLCYLALAVFQIAPFGFVDFPCESDLGNGPVISPNTDIVYCISLWPLHAISGGGVYASGASDQNETQAGVVNLKRQGQILYVNNHPIPPMGTYEFVQWPPSLNPWLLLDTRFRIKNEGLTRMGLSQSGNMLYVSGDVYERWLPNPLGFMILGGGIWLVVAGRRNRKESQINPDGVRPEGTISLLTFDSIGIAGVL